MFSLSFIVTIWPISISLKYVLRHLARFVLWISCIISHIISPKSLHDGFLDSISLCLHDDLRFRFRYYFHMFILRFVYRFEFHILFLQKVCMINYVHMTICVSAIFICSFIYMTLVLQISNYQSFFGNKFAWHIILLCLHDDLHFRFGYYFTYDVYNKSLLSLFWFAIALSNLITDALLIQWIILRHWDCWSN